MVAFDLAKVDKALLNGRVGGREEVAPDAVHVRATDPTSLVCNLDHDVLADRKGATGEEQGQRASRWEGRGCKTQSPDAEDTWGNGGGGREQPIETCRTTLTETPPCPVLLTSFPSPSAMTTRMGLLSISSSP